MPKNYRPSLPYLVWKHFWNRMFLRPNRPYWTRIRAKGRIPAWGGFLLKVPRNGEILRIGVYSSNFVKGPDKMSIDQAEGSPSRYPLLQEFCLNSRTKAFLMNWNSMYWGKCTGTILQGHNFVVADLRCNQLSEGLINSALLRIPPEGSLLMYLSNKLLDIRHEIPFEEPNQRLASFPQYLLSPFGWSIFGLTHSAFGILPWCKRKSLLPRSAL